MSRGLNAFGIAIMEPQIQSFEKSRFKCGQECRIHRSHIGYVDLRRECPDVEAIQKAAQVPDFIFRQCFLDFGKPCVGQTGKWKAPGRTHARDTDQKRKNFGHR